MRYVFLKLMDLSDKSTKLACNKKNPQKSEQVYNKLSKYVMSDYWKPNAAKQLTLFDVKELMNDTTHCCVLASSIKNCRNCIVKNTYIHAF